MLNKILIFIGLKIAEIGGLVFIPWGLGLVWHNYFPVSYVGVNFPHEWVAGFMITMVGFLLYLCGVTNWILVGNLIDKRGGE